MWVIIVLFDEDLWVNYVCRSQGVSTEGSSCV